MDKTASFRVIANRMRFICSSCGTKRNLPVQANIRRKRISCHACKAITKCILNRRAATRRFQSGKVTMRTIDGKEIEVNICDISTGGLGIEIPLRTARAKTISVGQEVRFSCKWNPRLLGNGSYVVTGCNVQRIGLKRIGPGV